MNQSVNGKSEMKNTLFPLHLKRSLVGFIVLAARFFFGLRWVDFVSTKPSKGIKVGGTSQGKPNSRFKS